MAINITPSKENILKRIRKALSHTTPLPFPQSEGNTSVYHPSRQEREIEFAEQFTKLQGKFAYCANSDEFMLQWNALLQQVGWTRIYCEDNQLKHFFGEGFAAQCTATDLASCEVSVTGCEALVARTGSMVLSAAAPQGRTASVYAPIHICIAFTHQLVYDIKDALYLVKDKYPGKLPSLITFATGPSRTADIEKTLVVGVHGPKEVYCFLIEG